MRGTHRLLVAAIICGIAFGPSWSKEKKSTAEERTRIVGLSKQYENNILASDAKPLATQIVTWWAEVPDLTVDWCANLLTDEGPADKDLAGAVTIQALAAAGVFVIEHPKQASDVRATWIAGLEGVVRAYRRLLTIDQGRRDAFLDKLSDMQSAGRLAEYVDAHSKDCH